MNESLSLYRDAVELFLEEKQNLCDAQKKHNKLWDQKPAKPHSAKNTTFDYTRFEETIRKNIESQINFGRKVNEKGKKKILAKREKTVKKMMMSRCSEIKTVAGNLQQQYQEKLDNWWQQVCYSQNILDKSHEDLNTALGMVREVSDAIWDLLPVLPDDYESNSNEFIAWRGTLLRRVIIEPDFLESQEKVVTQNLLWMKSFMGGDVVEFTNSLKFAKRYATQGFPLDPIQGEFRHDPIVVGRRIDNLASGNPNSNLDVRKFTFSVEEFLEERLKIFRVLRP